MEQLKVKGLKVANRLIGLIKLQGNEKREGC